MKWMSIKIIKLDNPNKVCQNPYHCSFDCIECVYQNDDSFNRFKELWRETNNE